MIVSNYYDSHQALTLGQTGVLGGFIGSAISAVASSAVATGFATGWLIGIHARGIGAGGFLCLAAVAGFIQGAIRYPVHYYLHEKLDTTAKKIAGLILEFLTSTFVLWLTAISSFHHPFHAALFYSSISFPVSLIACTILGMTFIGIENLYRNRIAPFLNPS